MKTSLVSAVISSVGPHFSLARSSDGREFFLGVRQGPMGFNVNEDQVYLDFVCGKDSFSLGTHVLLEPSNRDETHGNYRTYGWGTLTKAQDVWRVYRAQPVIFVMQRTRRALSSRRFGSWGRWKCVLTAHADVIGRESIRDGLRVSQADRFAPDYFNVGFHTQTKFTLENGVEVQDPRPFPNHTGSFYRVLRNIRGLPPKEIARGDATTIAYEYPRTEGDELEDHGDVTFTWQKGVGIDENKQPVWVSHHEDPRVPQLKIEALPLATINTAALAAEIMGNSLKKAA